MDSKEALEFAVETMRDAQRIYVRAEVDGQWGTHRLSDLPMQKQAKLIRQWFGSGVVPYRARNGERPLPEPSLEDPTGYCRYLAAIARPS